MKNKHKMLSLLMAAMIGVNGVGTLGEQVVFADEQVHLSITKATIHSDGVLKAGDYFDLAIYVSTNLPQVSEQGIIGLDNAEIEISGAASHSISTSGDWAQIQDPSNTTLQKILIENIKFNGKSNTLDVELWHPSLPTDGTGDKIASTIVTFDKDSIDLNATLQDATITQDTINVVAGESQQITLTVKNELDVPLEAGEMKLSIGDKDIAKLIEIKNDKHNVGTISPKDSKDFNINLNILEEIPRGVHELTVTLDDKTHVVKLKVDSNFMPPSLQVDMSYNGSFHENTPQEVDLEITNVGHIAAKNVTAKITGESVVVTNGSNIKYVENIESGSTVNVPVTLMVSDTSKYTVPLNLELKYIDDAGKEQTSTQTINLSTKGAVAQKEITLTTTQEPSGTINVGQSFDVGFKLSAPDGAENVTLKVEPTGGIVPKTKNLFIEPILVEGESKDYKVTFVAPQEVKTGTYAISMTATYSLNGEDVEVKTYATAFIENDQQEDDDEEGKGKPKVIVGNYATSPLVVQAGEEFVLDIGFLNTHATQKITNFKANLTINEEGENNTGSVFTPVQASNTFFIPELNPGETLTKNITMYTLPNAKSKTYEVTLQMSYDDAQGNEITATEFIGIPVEQVTKLEVAEVQTEMVEVGMGSDMTAIIYNTGKTDISNVMISIEGEGFDVEDGKMFEGLFEKGSDLMYMPTLYPYNSGILKGEIVIAYEDVTGVEQELRHPFEMEVMEPQMPPGGGDGDFEIPEIEEPVEETKEINWFILLGGVIGVGIAAGITNIVLKKRRKKLEELELDED